MMIYIVHVCSTNVVLSFFFCMEDNLLYVSSVDQILKEIVFRLRVMFREVFNDPGFNHWPFTSKRNPAEQEYLELLRTF